MKMIDGHKFGSEGLCPHCKHFDYCKGSSKLYGGTAVRHNCNGIMLTYLTTGKTVKYPERFEEVSK